MPPALTNALSGTPDSGLANTSDDDDDGPGDQADDDDAYSDDDDGGDSEDDRIPWHTFLASPGVAAATTPSSALSAAAAALSPGPAAAAASSPVAGIDISAAASAYVCNKIQAQNIYGDPNRAPQPRTGQGITTLQERLMYKFTSGKDVKVSLPDVSTRDGTAHNNQGWRVRPAWAGTVDISIEQIDTQYERIQRPIYIRGLVVPISTTGRPDAPEPKSQVRVSQGKKGSKDPQSSHFNPPLGAGRHSRNHGFEDVQKGHGMALELGGPDIKANIMPQFAQLQSNGQWREMEKEIEQTASGIRSKDTSRTLLFELECIYATVNPAHASIIRLGFPKGFIVKATEVFVALSTPVSGGFSKIWHFNQMQNQTDDMLAARVDLQVELRRGDVPDWNDIVARFGGPKEYLQLVHKALERDGRDRTFTDAEIKTLLAGEHPTTFPPPTLSYNSDDESDGPAVPADPSELPIYDRFIDSTVAGEDIADEPTDMDFTPGPGAK